MPGATAHRRVQDFQEAVLSPLLSGRAPARARSRRSLSDSPARFLSLSLVLSVRKMNTDEATTRRIPFLSPASFFLSLSLSSLFLSLSLRVSLLLSRILYLLLSLSLTPFLSTRRRRPRHARLLFPPGNLAGESIKRSTSNNNNGEHENGNGNNDHEKTAFEPFALFRIEEDQGERNERDGTREVPREISGRNRWKKLDPQGVSKERTNERGR